MTMATAKTLRFPQRRGTVTLRTVDGQTVLLDEADGSQHVVNLTAQALWELCDGETTQGEIAEAMKELFDAEPSLIDSEIDDTLRQLTSLGLLVWT